MKAPPVHNCTDCGTVMQVDAALGTGMCPTCLLEMALDVTPLETELLFREDLERLGVLDQHPFDLVADLARRERGGRTYLEATWNVTLRPE